MRIRKNAKISPLIYATSFLKPGTVIQTHDCQLNQSPWDVMDFSQPPSSPPPPHPTAQADESNICVENLSSLDSTPVVKREFSNVDEGECDDIATAIPDEAEQPRHLEDERLVIMCAKTDGKSWQCRGEAAKGKSLCEHHLSMARSYGSSTHSKKPGKQRMEARVHVRHKRTQANASSNPYAFYYYSGFGRRWSKKRGDVVSKDNGFESGTVKDVDGEHDQRGISVSSRIDEDIDYEDNDDGEKDEKNNIRKKTRRAIKARSLQSLM